MDIFQKIKQSNEDANRLLKLTEQIKNEKKYKDILNVIKSIRTFIYKNKNLYSTFISHISIHKSTTIKKIFIDKFKEKYWIVDEFGIKNLRFDLYSIERFNNNPKIIGYEIKTNKQDLVNDKKFEKYLNYCNILYFIVPEELKEEALKKINSSSLKKHIGLIIVKKELEEYKIIYIKIPKSNNKVFDIENIKRKILETGYFKYIYGILKINN